MTLEQTALLFRSVCKELGKHGVIYATASDLLRNESEHELKALLTDMSIFDAIPGEHFAKSYDHINSTILSKEFCGVIFTFCVQPDSGRN